MKKRLKGLVGLWLVVAMVCGMTLVPAMAAPANTYLGTDNGLISVTNFFNPNQPLNQQFSEMVTGVTGWNLWTQTEGSSGYASAVGESPYSANAVLGQKTYDDIEDTENLIIEPLFNTGVLIGGQEIPNVGSYDYYHGDYRAMLKPSESSDDYYLELAYTNSTDASDGYTLTINGLSIDEEFPVAIASLITDLTLVVQDCTWTDDEGNTYTDQNYLVGSSDSMSAGILAMKDLTITGTGTLNVAGGEAEGYARSSGGADLLGCSSFGICALGDLTISGSIVNTHGSEANNMSAGIFSAGNISIGGNANVTSFGGYTVNDAEPCLAEATEDVEPAANICAGIFSVSNITVNGGTVSAEGGDAYANSVGIVAYGEGDKNTSGGNININGGSVTAKGGYAESGNSYGIGASDENEAGGQVVITGGTVNTTGGAAYGGNSCGIGIIGGISISGGKIDTAGGDVSGGNSYGIGAVGNVKISGGEVDAIGGAADAGLELCMAAYDLRSYSNTQTQGDSFGIGAMSNVLISNFARLRAVGGSADNCSYGVGALGDIFINGNANVTVLGGGTNGDYIPGSYGLGAEGSVTLGGAAMILAEGLDLAAGAVNGITILPGNYLLYANKALTSLDKLDWPATWYFQMVPAPVYDNYVPEYRIEVKDGIEDGTVTTRVKYAAEGDRVGITVTPEEGFELDQLIVTTPKGKEIETTYINGKYIFEMPASKVLIDAVFVADVALPFLDVTVDDWYFDAVKYVYDNDIMAGTGATAFAPDTELSRAMVAQVLYNLDEERYIADDALFADVVPGEWYVNAVNWAAAEKIFAGYGNGNFGTLDSVTREQLAVILYNYAVSKDGAVSGSSVLGMYPDAGEISFWAVEAMEWAVANDILRAESGLLTAAANASRADVAYAMMNFCENIMQK